MRNKMGSKFIRVRVERPQPNRNDIELIQEVIAYHIINIFKFCPALRGFSQYDLEIDIQVKPVVEQKDIPVNVFGLMI